MKFGLIGNPNVGKSLIFQQLTGLGVEVSNYPGTTVDLMRGNVCYKREIMEIVDLPGIYSLDGDSDEEKTVRSFVQSGQADIYIAVLDASHLERNLYLLIQMAEYEKPMLIVLNMMDEAAKHGFEIDIAGLEEMFGVQVITTTAIQGKNIGNIIPKAIFSPLEPHIEVRYDHHIEAAVRSLESLYPVSRREALQSLEGLATDPDLMESADFLALEIEKIHHMSTRQIIAGNRHHCAANIAGRVIKEKEPHRYQDMDRILTTTMPGLPILFAILVFTLMTVFVIGSWLEGIIVGLFDIIIIQPFLQMGLQPFFQEIGFAALLALQAGFGIAFPFVFTFYLFISILEDSGYLTRAAFLADRFMHRLGMHGQGIIPIVLGFGCNVPAIMSIRFLKSRRERIIASFLVSMIPCSARTVIVAGIVAAFVGITAALSIYVIIFFLVIITGILLSRITPGEQYGMILEMAPLRRPILKNVLSKSWIRIKEFLYIAMPLLIIASIFLGILQYIGAFDIFQAWIEPFSTMVLGLPSYATTALIFGILRKEMALETLVILAGTADLASVMTGVQLYIFAIVSVLFIPCISTIAVLRREVGIKIAVLVSIYTLFLGIGIGALINLLIK
ncbi:MAG TPA: ferrous iron transport protein B [Methanoregulaceae archaeon]|nr:ferrous iron transport protein B [Methanoregulaceae archaeon]